MSDKAAISLATGLEDAERVTVALLVAVAAAEAGRPTLVFLSKEAVRLATEGVAVGKACEGCPDIPALMSRLATAGGHVAGLSHLLPSEGAGRSGPHRKCDARGHGAAVGVDRVGGRLLLQLLTTNHEPVSEGRHATYAHA